MFSFIVTSTILYPRQTKKRWVASFISSMAFIRLFSCTEPAHVFLNYCVLVNNSVIHELSKLAFISRFDPTLPVVTSIIEILRFEGSNSIGKLPMHYYGLS